MKWVARLLIAAFLAGPALAMAQPKIPFDPLKLNQKLEQARQASIVPANPQRLLDLLSQPMQDLANFISGDFSGAATLAGSIPGMPDGNGNSCWNMLAASNGIFKEAPPNGPLPGPATVLEQLRLLAMIANRVCQNAACTQVFTEAGNALNTVAPINGLPSLTLLCSKVPSVAQVAITTPPAPIVAPTPAPTPSPVPSATPTP